MFENLFRNIKNRFSSATITHSPEKHNNYVYTTTTISTTSPAKSQLNKIFDLKFNYYLPIGQKSEDDDDNYCTFMMPRVYEQKICLGNSGKNSPVALDFRDERLCDDLENVVDKFVYMIDVERLRCDYVDDKEKLIDDRVEKIEKRIKHHEEIRRRLQMVEENGTLKSLLNKGKANRPSLQSRLKNGKNLQICFMNENISDGESPSSDSESCPKLSDKTKKVEHGERNSAPVFNGDENDFFTHQAKLQIEARMALAQAKDMAHLQMELEKQKTQCPVTQIIHNALQHASIQMPEGKRRVSRQLLTEFTVPQLRIIVNELNGNIEKLNEHLVQILMERDELHMGQDSMLVDIEDLTRYLAAKEAPLVRSDDSRLSDKKFKNLTQEASTKVENGNGTSSRFFRLSSFGKQ